ncbi:MAG: 1-deoxy-D-xylulose-5-phosphate reductoisomerase, partial [Rhizomicrobium sp.]
MTEDLSSVTTRKVTVLGSTGSIGVSTLDVIAHARTVYGDDAFPIEALTAQSNVELLAEQAKRFKPKMAVIGDTGLSARLKELLAGTGIAVAS